MPPDEVKPLLSITSAIHKTNTKQTFSDCEGSDQDPWAYNWLVCTGILPSFFGNPSNLGILGWHQFRIPTLMFKSSVQKESLWYWLWLSPQLFQAIVSPHQADQCLSKPILFSIWITLDPNLLQLSIRTLNLAHTRHFLLPQSDSPSQSARCVSWLSALGIPEWSLCLTSSTCHGAGKEVSLSPLVADGLVKEELDHAAFGRSVPGLDRENGDGTAYSTQRASLFLSLLILSNTHKYDNTFSYRRTRGVLLGYIKDYIDLCLTK